MNLYFKKINKQKGQVMILSVIFFICISTFIILAIANPLVRHISMASSITSSKQSFYAAEAGIEDVIYRLQSNKPIASSNILNIGTHSAITAVTDTSEGKMLIATGQANDYIRKLKANLIFGSGISFHYGIQAGKGGFELRNSSTVTGNIHSSGPVIGASNEIFGDVVSAGASGIIKGIRIHGSGYSHTIKDSIIDNDAYYFATSTFTNNNVFGGLFAGSADQPPVDLPISDAQIAVWENYAETGTVIPATSCPGGTYTITSNITLGPAKIDCNLFIKGNGVQLTMTGPIWVVGNITTQNAPIIKISPTLGSQNIALIADNPSDRSGSGIITIGQNTEFYGSGFSRSFVFIISQNNSSETGGTTDAFVMGQSAGALVSYASHGQITLGQSVRIKEATAYKIILKNTANVTYDTGLPSALFSTGPTGGFDIDSWKEIE